MSQTTRPPFRADHVGSLLRPQRLKNARETLLGAQTADAHLGPHGNDELARIEDDCIRDVIALQKKAGLKAATDGEFRRRSWWLELIMTWSGATANRQDASSPFGWKNEQGKQQDFSHLHITGKIEWQPSAVVKAFEFLRDNTTLVPKVTLPSPPVIHCFSGGDPANARDYPPAQTICRSRSDSRATIQPAITSGHLERCSARTEDGYDVHSIGEAKMASSKGHWKYLVFRIPAVGYWARR